MFTMTRSSISGDARPALMVPKFLFTDATHLSILSICMTRSISFSTLCPWQELFSAKTIELVVLGKGREAYCVLFDLITGLKSEYKDRALIRPTL